MDVVGIIALVIWACTLHVMLWIALIRLRNLTQAIIPDVEVTVFDEDEEDEDSDDEPTLGEVMNRGVQEDRQVVVLGRRVTVLEENVNAINARLGD